MKQDPDSEKRYRGVDPRYQTAALGTRCVHAGETVDPIDSIPIATPLYSAASYTYPHSQDFEDLLEGRRTGYAYARWGTPTNAALETALSSLIGGGKTISTASGMAANFVALQAAGAGQGKTILLSRDVYGNTYDIIKNAFETFGARAVFAAKKNLRLLLTDGLPDPIQPGSVFRSVAGGFLVQSRDLARITPADLTIVTRRQPSDAEVRDMLFAFTVAKHVKSNAIVYAKDGQTAGIGAGQMNRRDSARIAAIRAREAGEAQGLPSLAEGSACASEAFFPFADGLLEAVAAGATSVIQPGGSIRDTEVIAAADDKGIAMAFTGTRVFRH